MLNFPNSARQYPKGWSDIVHRLVAKLSELPGDIEVLQVKSKFGTLRFYTRGTLVHWETVDALVREAEAESAVTCEQCGATAKTTSVGYYIVTLCDKHLEELKNEQKRKNRN